MYIDSKKTQAQIARDVKAQQQKRARAKGKRKPAEDRAKKLAEILDGKPEEKPADEIVLKAEDVKHIEGVNEIPEGAEVHEGACIEGDLDPLVEDEVLRELRDIGDIR